MSIKSVCIIIVLTLFFAPVTFAQTNTTSDSATPHDLLMERKENLRKDRIELKSTLENIRKNKREEFRTKKLDFRTKLQSIKDTRKKTIVERIDTKLTKINIDHANRMDHHLVKIEMLLEKFASKTAELNTKGVDTKEVDEAIISARIAIDDAKVAVATQSANEYIAVITDENGLKNAMGEAMKQLRIDLNETLASVKNAKEKVIQVARILAIHNGE